MKGHPDKRPPQREPTLRRDDLDERPPWRESTLRRDHFEETPPWLRTTLMRDHTDERAHAVKRPPWQEASQTRHYPSERPPWWKTLPVIDHLMRDHPTERPPRWKGTVMRDHPNKRASDEKQPIIYDHFVSSSFSLHNSASMKPWPETTTLLLRPSLFGFRRSEENGSTETSSGNCPETETRMVRARHTPQPLQNHPSGNLGGWATPWSAEKIPANSPCQNSEGPPSENTGRECLLNRPSCSSGDPCGP